MPKRILLVDDDQDDRLLFCEALEDVAPEIECITAVNARAAISQLKNREIEPPDIIFLDINMPLLNGWQCLSLLKQDETYKSIPVIMYSTSSNPEDIERVRELGALCLFTKPADFRTLKRSLGNVAKYLQNNCLPSFLFCSSLFILPDPQ